MTDAPSPSRPAREAALPFILITVVLDMLSIGIIIPVMPRIVERFFPGQPEAGAMAFGTALTLWALLQFFSSPIMGALSDRYGRRPIILVSCVGLGLSYFCTALAPTYALFLAARMISGTTAANISAVNAYIADVTEPKDRAKAYGMLGAAFGVGFSFGPALGGLLGSENIHLPLLGPGHMELPLFVAGTLCLLNAAYGWFVLPESLPLDRRAPFQWRKANPVGAFSVFKGQRSLFALLPVHGLFALAHSVFPTCLVLFAEHRFHFDTLTTGLTMAANSVLGIISQAFLIQPLVRRLGERRAMIVGLSFGAAAMSAYAFAPNAYWFWASMPLMMLFGLFTPSMQSTMTRRVDPSSQGRLQGGLASITAAAGIVAPTLFTWLFAIGLKIPFGDSAMVGLPFLAAALFLVCGASIVALRVRDQEATARPGL